MYLALSFLIIQKHFSSSSFLDQARQTPHKGTPVVELRELQQNVRARSADGQCWRANELNLELHRCIPIGATL